MSARRQASGVRAPLDRLQGLWTVVSLEVDGRPMPFGALGEASIEVKASRFETRGMGGDYRGVIAASTLGRQKTLDLSFASGPHTGETKPGIYRIDRGRWTICLGMTGPRPTAFTTAPGDGRALEVLVRHDRTRVPIARKRRETPTPRPPARRPSARATELDGEWTMVRMIESGKPVGAEMVRWCRRITADGETSVLAATRVMMHARFTHDPSASPRRIDYEGAAPQLGIYELDGDRLTICMARAGAERPTTFASRPRDGRVLTEWRRAKT